MPSRSFMDLAMKQAKIAGTSGEVPIGCVIVHDGAVIGRGHNQVERLQDFVGIELHIAHHLPEHVPLRLRERQADVLVREERMLAPAGFVERAIDDTRGRISQFALRNVEIVVFHGALHPRNADRLTAIRGPTVEPVDEYGLTVERKRE